MRGLLGSGAARCFHHRSDSAPPEPEVLGAPPAPALDDDAALVLPPAAVVEEAVLAAASSAAGAPWQPIAISAESRSAAAPMTVGRKVALFMVRSFVALAT
jgi:hypothetical protein